MALQRGRSVRGKDRQEKDVDVQVVAGSILSTQIKSQEHIDALGRDSGGKRSHASQKKKQREVLK